MPRTVAELLENARSLGGERDFFTAGGKTVSFAAFVERAQRVASGLVGRGLQPADRVAILLPRGLDEAVATLGAVVAGGIAVPIHAKLKDDQVRHVLVDAEPRLVISDAGRTVALRDSDAVLAGQQVVGCDEVARGEPAVAAPLAPEDVAVLLYTSGSTGPAKGIAQTHHNLTLGARLVADYVGLGADDHVLALLSFSFDYGLNQLLGALLVAARITVSDHLGVGELATLLATHRPTGLAGVPSLWREVAAGLRTGALGDEHGRSLRYVTNSGGALRVDDSGVIRARWPHVAVFAMYGLTEAFRSAFLPPAEFDAHPTSFGYALPGVELLLVDPDSGAVLEGPATGELVHCGELVADGYWRRTAEQHERFRPDPRGTGRPVVFSGDLVRRDEHGRHYFVARRDKMLKVQGHRVSPDEVAAAVRDMDGIGDVFVFGLDGGADGHRIVLCCGGDPADQRLLADVRRRCRARLPSYMVPEIVRVLPTLPLNANGKVDEQALRTIVDACTGDT